MGQHCRSSSTFQHLVIFQELRLFTPFTHRLCIAYKQSGGHVVFQLAGESAINLRVLLRFWQSWIVSGLIIQICDQVFLHMTMHVIYFAMSQHRMHRVHGSSQQILLLMHGIILAIELLIYCAVYGIIQLQQVAHNHTWS